MNEEAEVTTEPIKKDERIIIDHHQEKVNKKYGYYASFMLKDDFEKYPERWLRGVVAPPTVVEYIGVIEDFMKEGQIILFTDDISFVTDLNEMQLKYNFSVCAPKVDVDGTTNLVMATPVGTGIRVSRMFMRLGYLIPWAAMISDICLWRKDTLTEIQDVPSEIFKGKTLLAVPGNAGSLPNQLIKSRRWDLCDCASDIIDAVERKAKDMVVAEAIKKGKGDK
jgi:hypothetical protein